MKKIERKLFGEIVNANPSHKEINEMNFYFKNGILYFSDTDRFTYKNLGYVVQYIYQRAYTKRQRPYIMKKVNDNCYYECIDTKEQNVILNRLNTYLSENPKLAIDELNAYIIMKKLLM